ncbi:MAG: hypothetical protein FWF67_02795 [Fibromonadales bacterium]|nr:hypothetical protein [Fibromonadales bacterium]
MAKQYSRQKDQRWSLDVAPSQQRTYKTGQGSHVSVQKNRQAKDSRKIFWGAKLMPKNEDSLCDSREWWPTIKEIANDFEKQLISIGEENSIFIQLDMSRLNSALDMYEQSWRRLKIHTYGKEAIKEHIDRHKVIALYILSFLAKEPFSLRVNPKKQEVDRRLETANELFSLEIMQELISGWENAQKPLKLSKNEKTWLVILFNNLKLKLAESKPAVINDKPDRLADFLSLAQIVYYIEKSCV